ncbi:YceI family protein [Vibrio cholerae]|uniref:YceI family protein n=1 Tax=Vibrio cholerae TaxID=666 RepID=A0A7Z7VJ79_VIBCL|nr:MULTISPECIES: YceI family protein [Vibrio]EJL6492814.1 YceI family protein [Vibrio cholerae]EJL6644441.1 YceI family protein [Vibrio cholerae]MBL4244478.1 YceI family protein [Vibrio fluvialis]MBL4253368.1 YceI family protein [Vibrio fluvialis]MCA2422584.1 YceI family protein [Vibrio alginolyticus]
MKKSLIAAGLFLSMAAPLAANAADYKIDTSGAHASINFAVSHLGYSITQGRFNDFEGTFSYDENNIEASKVKVVVDTTSLDSNHAERDKHIRSADFIDAGKFSTATFTSTKVVDKKGGNMDVIGDLTLHGITHPITINASVIGGGADPWGGERLGLKGTTRLELKDFGIKEMGATTYADMTLYVEGIKQ